MKIKYLTIILFFSLIQSLQSQTYYFQSHVEKVNLDNGSLRVLNSYSGQYRFEFEKPSDPQIKKLFTIYNPGQGYNSNWFGLLSDEGFLEKNNKIYKKSIYFDTENSSNVMVLIANDNSGIIIFKSDGTIHEYK